MKRLFPLFIIGIACIQASAQNQVDALRYSQIYPGGTARSTAMGGAFGALGGDFYSASLNPAGLGVYRSSEFTFTPELLLIVLVMLQHSIKVRKDLLEVLLPLAITSSTILTVTLE
jgi:hypothetical protein